MALARRARGYDPVYGARPLKRAIQRYIENPLAMEILKGNFPEGAQVRVDAGGDRMVFTREYTRTWNFWPGQPAAAIGRGSFAFERRCGPSDRRDLKPL